MFSPPEMMMSFLRSRSSTEPSEHHAHVAAVVDELPQHVLQMPTPEDRYVGGTPPRSLPVTHREGTASGLIGSTAEPTLPAQRCWVSSMPLLRLLIDLLILRGRPTPIAISNCSSSARKTPTTT